MEFEKQIDGAPKNEDLLERWARGDRGRIQPDGTPIKNGDWLKRGAQEDNGRAQPDGTPVGISPTRSTRLSGDVAPLPNETEQTQKRPPTRLILALVAATVCIGGTLWIGSARDAAAPTGSLNRPLEGIGARTSFDAMPDDATAGALGRLTPSNRSQPGRPQPPHALSSAEEAKLVARAESLIKQFDFASARLLLAYALEKGSARAAFMMAETYDWQILRSLQAYGVRGDAQKAREFYQLAAEAGVEKAQERVEALQSGANFDTRVGGETRSR
jgi:TPR repeat protein